MLSSNTHITGLWHNPVLGGEKFFGTLYIFDDNVFLELYFNQNDVQEKKGKVFIESFKENKSAVIHGYSGGPCQPQKYTLIDNYITAFETASFKLMLTGILRIQTKKVFEGIHLNTKDENIFYKAKVLSSYAKQWIPAPYYQMNGTGEEEVLNYSLRKNIYSLYKNDIISLNIEAGLSATKHFSISQRFELENRVDLVICSEKKMNYETIKQCMSFYNTFVILLSGNNSDILDITYCYDKNDNFKQYKQTWVQIKKTRITNNQNLVDFSTISNLETVFTNWWHYSEQNLTANIMLFNILQKPEVYFDDIKTENFTQVIEAIMRYKFGETITISSNHLNYFKNEDQKSPPNKNIESSKLVGKFIYIFLEKYKDFFLKDFQKFFNKSDDEIIIEFIKNCISIRDNYSHGGLDDNNRKYNPKLLNIILLKAIRLVLINEILELNIKEIPLESI